MVSLEIDICISKGHSDEYNEHYEKPQIQQEFFVANIAKASHDWQDVFDQ